MPPSPEAAIADFADIVSVDGTKRYKVKRPIGAGAFSTVIQLEEVATGRLVVGKFMDTTSMGDKNRNFALAEAENASKCKHPNIIEFIECVAHNGKLLLVFEFADAGDLFAQISSRAPAKKHFREPEILLILTQLSLALNAMHRKKMLHRDLKSPNVFLTMSGLIKLGDFGFSREYDSTVSDNVGSTFCGTPYYLAPELWNQASYGKKADVWSLGVVLYELMALKKPFSGGSIRDLVKNVMTGHVDPLPELYSKELRELCMSMLNLDPEKRPSITDIFEIPVVRQQGLSKLLTSVPRLTTVAEPIRRQIIEDVEQVLASTAPPATAAPEVTAA
jgi:serine/threonine protein kinase